MKKEDEGRMIQQVADMHTALMGNGRAGLLEQFNTWKGGLKVITILLSSGLIGLAIKVFIGG